MLAVSVTAVVGSFWDFFLGHQGALLRALKTETAARGFELPQPVFGPPNGPTSGEVCRCPSLSVLICSALGLPGVPRVSVVLALVLLVVGVVFVYLRCTQPVVEYGCESRRGLAELAAAGLPTRPSKRRPRALADATFGQALEWR